jgi:hypothetical protein
MAEMVGTGSVAREVRVVRRLRRKAAVLRKKRRLVVRQRS